MENRAAVKIKDLYHSGRNKKILCQCKICGDYFEMWDSHFRRGSSGCDCWKLKKNNPRLYSIWTNIKTRCNNVNTPSFNAYGKRGISVCAEWSNSFKAFCEWAMAHGYADNLTIDRIDVDGNYEPLNCRWVDNICQANNKRNNVLFWGMSLRRLCVTRGLNYKTEHSYLSRHGYDAERIRLETKLIELGGCDEDKN